MQLPNFGHKINIYNKGFVLYGKKNHKITEKI